MGAHQQLPRTQSLEMKISPSFVFQDDKQVKCPQRGVAFSRGPPPATGGHCVVGFFVLFFFYCELIKMSSTRQVIHESGRPLEPLMSVRNECEHATRHMRPSNRRRGHGAQPPDDSKSASGDAAGTTLRHTGVFFSSILH